MLINLIVVEKIISIVVEKIV